MDRRDFISSVVPAAAAVAAGTLATQRATGGQTAASPVSSGDAIGGSASRGTFALDGHRVRFTHPAILEPWSMFMVADTHLFREDDRDAEYRQYSARMARAYNQTEHFETGQPTNPEECFEQTLQRAREHHVRLVALVGDILSFPSPAAVEWVCQKLQAADLPYLYVAGNHDWHYEGLPGSLAELRSHWIEQRLRPIYQQSSMPATDSPLATSLVIGGVRIVALDNSNYEIAPAQLEFFQQQIAHPEPILLVVHIPLYAPHRSVGFGCGHPDWGAANDKNFELERRERWPVAGHTPVTLEFHKTVFDTPQLLGVLAGHIHQPSLDIVRGVPQVVTGHNATGAHLQVEFYPQS